MGVGGVKGGEERGQRGRRQVYIWQRREESKDFLVVFLAAPALGNLQSQHFEFGLNGNQNKPEGSL